MRNNVEQVIYRTTNRVWVLVFLLFLPYLVRGGRVSTILHSAVEAIFISVILYLFYIFFVLGGGGIDQSSKFNSTLQKVCFFVFSSFIQLFFQVMIYFPRQQDFSEMELVIKLISISLFYNSIFCFAVWLTPIRDSNGFQITQKGSAWESRILVIKRCGAIILYITGLLFWVFFGLGLFQKHFT